VVRTDPVDAYAYCERLAQSHYENFPVASWLLPAAMRPPIAAIYAFARIADDMADEGARPQADRLADLERWGLTLDAALHGEFELSNPQSAVFIALADAIDRFDLPADLFRDLLSAFRQDVIVSRYPTWDAVMDYCRRSANPVGRLVLRVAGYDDPALDRASDAVCTALQLTNFWQDLEVDWRKGRLYVPLSIVTQYGAHETDLSAGRLTPEWRAALKDVAAGRASASPPDCRCVTRSAGACDSSCARRGSAATGFSTSSNPQGSTCLRSALRSRVRTRRSSSGVRCGGICRWRAIPAFITRSSCCRPSSAARSWPSGISAAR
jgi:phytoene synthase